MSSQNWERRRVGAGSAAALIVGNMIGAGVFTTSGFALADLGSREWVLAAWLLGGAIALCGALSYGGLASRIPRSGGEYTFLSEALHPLAGFLAGWVSLLAGFTAPIALAAHVLEVYTASAFATGLPSGWIGALAILFFGGVHGLRLGIGVSIQNVVVVAKLCAIAGFVFSGWSALPESAGTSPEAAPTWGAFAVTLIWISFAYSGWNGAVYLAGEIRDPAKNIPRALWLTTVGVALVYVALNAVLLWSAPASELSGRADIGRAAAEALGGPTAGRWTAALVAVALATSISAMMMAGPRVYAQMARDGVFPAWFGAGRDAPSAAVLLQMLLALAVYWASGLRELLGYLGFTLGLSAALTVFAAAKLRHREGARAVPIPGYPWIPAAFIVFTVGAASFLVVREPSQAGIGVLTLLAGWPIYALQRRRAGRIDGSRT